MHASTCARVGNSFVLCVYMCVLCTKVRVCMGVRGDGMCCVCNMCRSVVICMFYQVLCNVGEVVGQGYNVYICPFFYAVLCLWCVCMSCVCVAYKHDCLSMYISST